MEIPLRAPEGRRFTIGVRGLFVLRERPAVALIIASRALVDTSVQDVAALFFVKERGWYASDVAAYIGIFGLCGIFANSLFPLWASLRGAPSSTAVNLFSMTCNVLHVIAIGALEDKYLVMLATPLGTLSNIGFSACTAMITGESDAMFFLTPS